MKRKTILPALLVLLFLVGTTSAMRSDHFWLDWHTPLTTCGGGPASSANYAVDVSIGQVVIGTSSSTNYAICLGYWCAVEQLKVICPAIPLLLLGDD